MERACQLLEIHPADDLADGLGAHPGAEDAATLGAAAVSLVELAVLGLAEGLHRLEGFELVAQLAQLVLAALGLLGKTGPLVLERVVHAGLQVGDLLLDRAGLVDLALLELCVDPLGLGAGDLAQPGGGFLATLVPGGDDDLAGRCERDRLLGRAGLEVGEGRLRILGGRGDLLGPRGAVGLEPGARVARAWRSARPCVG